MIFWISLLVAACASYIVMVGSQRMKRLESMRLSKTAAILSLTPISAACWCPIFLFIGIWNLKVLNRRDIAAAFEVKKKEMSEAQPVRMSRRQRRKQRRQARKMRKGES